MTYWHELSEADRQEAKQRLKTDKAIQAEYLAPKWCGLGQDALLYIDGCWSLLLTEESVYEDFCKTCDMYNQDELDKIVEKK